MPLTPKQERFVAEYLVDLNATQAAIRSGYSQKTARQIGDRLLSKGDIQAAVSAGKARQLTSADLNAARVLEELRRLSFASAKDLFDERGNLLPLKDLPAELASAIAGVEVVIKNAAAGDGHTDTVHKIKLWDKPRSLEMLAKHFSLLVERQEVTIKGAIEARLVAGRKRLQLG